MRIIVIGGNGFVGRHCCVLLREQGHDVFSPTSAELDITQSFMIEEHVDVCIHLGAYNITSIGDKNEEAYRKVNIEGTQNVMDGISCDHFIFLSTAKVNDDPKSAYAKSKEEAEKICKQYFSGKVLTIIRSVNVLGRGQAPKAVLPVFIDLARKNEPLELTVHPATPIDYIDVRDLTALILNTIQYPQGGVYYAAYPQPTTVLELALKVVAACHSSSKIKQITAHVPAAPKQINCAETWDDFKFKPRYGIDAILESMLS